MMTRKLGWWAAAIAVGLGIVSATTADYLLAAGAENAKQDLKPAVSLPITRVKEQLDGATSVALTNNSEGQVRYLLSLSEISPSLKKQLTEAMAFHAVWQGVQREAQQVAADLAVLQQDQERIRKNLRETPKEAEVYETYLKKLSAQEKEIDALTAKQKKLSADEFNARKRYEDFLANVSD